MFMSPVINYDTPKYRSLLNFYLIVVFSLGFTFLCLRALSLTEQAARTTSTLLLCLHLAHKATLVGLDSPRESTDLKTALFCRPRTILLHLHDVHI